ncbi:LOW QUALITY PROTEIN: fatty-acid amide hydrolase 2 [Dugong dugon]
MQLLFMRAIGFLIGLVGQAAAFGCPKFGSRISWRVNKQLILLLRVQLAKLIQRKMKCVDVLQAYINRISDVNPMINGIVKYRFKAVMNESYAVDQKLAENQKKEDEATLEKKWPFFGVPLTVKEAFQIQGMPNSSGLVNHHNTCLSHLVLL